VSWAQQLFSPSVASRQLPRQREPIVVLNLESVILSAAEGSQTVDTPKKIKFFSKIETFLPSRYIYK